MKKVTDLLYMCSCLLLLIGAALAFRATLWVNVLFAVGAAGYLLSYMLSPRPTGDNQLRKRRLHRMGFLSALLFGISATYRFIGHGQQEWLLFFAVGMVFMIYSNVLLMKLK